MDMNDKNTGRNTRLNAICDAAGKVDKSADSAPPPPLGDRGTAGANQPGTDGSSGGGCGGTGKGDKDAD